MWCMLRLRTIPSAHHNIDGASKQIIRVEPFCRYGLRNGHNGTIGQNAFNSYLMADDRAALDRQTRMSGLAREILCAVGRAQTSSFYGPKWCALSFSGWTFFRVCAFVLGTKTIATTTNDRWAIVGRRLRHQRRYYDIQPFVYSRRPLHFLIYVVVVCVYVCCVCSEHD